MVGALSGLALILVGLSLLWIGWVGSQRRLGRNRWAGIRTPSTMASDSAWFAAHQAAAGPFGVSGGAVGLLGIAVLATGLDLIGQIALALALGIALCGTLVAGVVGVKAARAVGGKAGSGVGTGDRLQR